MKSESSQQTTDEDLKDLLGKCFAGSDLSHAVSTLIHEVIRLRQQLRREMLDHHVNSDLIWDATRDAGLAS